MLVRNPDTKTPIYFIERIKNLEHESYVLYRQFDTDEDGKLSLCELESILVIQGENQLKLTEFQSFIQVSITKTLNIHQFYSFQHC